MTRLKAAAVVKMFLFRSSTAERYISPSLTMLSKFKKKCATSIRKNEMSDKALYNKNLLHRPTHKNL